MKKNFALWILAGALATGAAFAAEDQSNPDIDAKLEAARARLEAAAHEVAELSAEAGKPVMDHFMGFHGDGPRRAIIGVQLDPESGKDGAKVKDVSPGGPAAEAGVKAGDVIVAVNGTAIKDDSTREVMRLMHDVKPESSVNVRVMRDGRPRDIIVIARPYIGGFNIPMPPPPGFPGMGGEGFDTDTPITFTRSFHRDFADMELATLTPQLGRYFGTTDGILVVRKPEGDALKLEEGDVILSIGGRKPTSGSHATRILRSYQPGEKVHMEVMRQKKPLSLDVTLPEGLDHPHDQVFRTR